MRSILISSINNRKQAISAAKNKLNMSLLKAAAFIDSIISNKYPTILVYEDQEAYHFVLVMSLFSDAKIIYSEQEKEEQKRQDKITTAIKWYNQLDYQDKEFCDILISVYGPCANFLP